MAIHHDSFKVGHMTRGQQNFFGPLPIQFKYCVEAADMYITRWPYHQHLNKTEHVLAFDEVCVYIANISNKTKARFTLQTLLRNL